MPCRDDYPVLDELPASLPPTRTSLYRLAPIGVGTGCRESLTSYAERLADAHCLTPRFLAEVPGIDSVYRGRFKAGTLIWKRCFNSGGVTSVEWAARFGELTGRAGLDALTLAPIARIVNQRNLIARERRWCPKCLRQAESVGTPYAQLIWELACVTACPLHEIELSGRCTCNVAPDPQRRAKRLPGLCPRCGRSLAETLPKRQARIQAVRVARVAYALLGETRFDAGGWRPSDDRSGEFLRSVAAIHFEGNAARLAKALGVSKSSLHEWASGEHRPTLTWLVTLANGLGCAVVDVLDARAGVTHAPDGDILRTRRTDPLKVTSRQRASIAEQLTALLADPVAISLHRVALRLKVNTDFLRKQFPAQSAAIVSRFKAEQSAQTLARKDAFLATIRAKARQLAATGVWPTSRRLLQGMRLGARYAEFHAELNQILVEVRQQIENSKQNCVRG